MGHDNYFIIFRLWQERQEIIEEREKEQDWDTLYARTHMRWCMKSCTSSYWDVTRDAIFWTISHSLYSCFQTETHPACEHLYQVPHTTPTVCSLQEQWTPWNTHTDTECLSLVIMGASNTLSFSLFKSITNLSVTIFSYKVYFLHRWIKPQPAHTQATWLPAVWLTARRPKVNVLGGMQCFSTVVGCIHYKEKAHPPPITFGTHKKREKKDSGGGSWRDV